MSDNQDWQSQVAGVAASIRKRGFGYVMANNGGYLSQLCSSAEIFAYLYVRGMNLGPSIAPMIPDPFVCVPGQGRPYISGADYNGSKSPEKDRFIFSPAHYALVLYLTLIETGRMAPEGLDKFNQDGSIVEMISAEHSPGAEVTTGSLAQALSIASGIAMARRMRGETGNTWVLMSDGEFQEGQTWEAVQALAAFGLDNVKVIVDVNEQQCGGPMETVMPIGSLSDKLNAFGAAAFDVEGHDIEAFDELAQRNTGGKPLFILARTNPTQGIPVLESRRPVLHYLRFSSEEEKSMFQTAYEEMLSEV